MKIVKFSLMPGVNTQSNFGRIVSTLGVSPGLTVTAMVDDTGPNVACRFTVVGFNESVPNDFGPYIGRDGDLFVFWNPNP